MASMLTWLVRYGHVLSGAVWVGGYAFLALAVIPLLEKNPSETLSRLAIRCVRMLTYAGTLTIGFGVVLITRSRGFGNLLRGEWGFIILTCIVFAVVLLGLGDSALRPALRQLAATGDGRAARRLAVIALVLAVLAIGLMTRAVYART